MHTENTWTLLLHTKLKKINLPHSLHGNWFKNMMTPTDTHAEPPAKSEREINKQAVKTLKVTVPGQTV